MTDKKENKKSLLEMDISFGWVSRTQVVLFAKHLAIMLRSGLTITESLDVARESASGKFKSILNEIISSVQSGGSVSVAFSQYSRVFSELFINMTMAGEKSGNLSDNLERVADQLRKDRDLILKIRGAMVYPIVVLVTAFILGMVLILVILPKILPLFENLKIDLPFSTKLLISFSHFIGDYGSYFFFSVIIFIIGIAWVVRQKFARPATDWLLLNMPIIRGIVFNANISRFSSTMGTLLKSGILLDEAVDITKDTLSNFYYKEALEKINEGIRTGKKLADSMIAYPDLFPVIVTRMVNVGEESGRLEETFFYLAGLYESEVDNSIKSLSTSIEPLLLLVIGAVVGFLAVSIITPIYSITGGIGR